MFFASLGAAVFTLGLVVATLVLVAKTVRTNTLAEKHHQELLMPAVTYRGVFSIKPRDPTGMHTYSYITYSGLLQNVGLGPALNVKAKLSTEHYGEAEYDIGFLPPSYEHAQHSMTTYLDQNIDLNQIIPRVMQPVTYTLLLTYENVFGQVGYTTHRGAVNTMGEETPPAQGMTTEFTAPPIDITRIKSI